jgi:hypothetical protein
MPLVIPSDKAPNLEPAFALIVYEAVVDRCPATIGQMDGAAERRPALSASRTKPVVLALRVTIGSAENERDLLGPHSFPLRSLRVRSLWADPLALLPLSLPCERRPRIRFDWRRCADGATVLSSLCLPSRRPSASRRAGGRCLCRAAAEGGRSPPFI